MFWENYVKYCAFAGKAPNVVAAECGVKSTGTVSGWKKGAIPRDGILRNLADYFGITVADLLGEEEKPATETGDELDATTKELLNLAATLDPADVHMLLDMAKAIKARRKDDEK